MHLLQLWPWQSSLSVMSYGTELEEMHLQDNSLLVITDYLLACVGLAIDEMG